MCDAEEDTNGETLQIQIQRIGKHNVKYGDDNNPVCPDTRSN